MVIRFRIGSSLRFLSHAETLRLFQRACVRADINLRYSQGFNPHPKMSLPLPRPVGVESDDELLTLRVRKSIRAQEHKGIREQEHRSIGAQEHRSIGDAYDLCTCVRDNLSEQLPRGCELISVETADRSASFGSCSATYVFAVKPEYLGPGLESRIDKLLGSDSLVVRRMTDRKKSKYKDIDVRDFIESIELDRGEVNILCVTTSAGSIRIGEVLELMELDMEKLASPIRRTSVQWRGERGDRTKHSI